MRSLVPITDESVLILPTRRRALHVRGLGTMTPETGAAAGVDITWTAPAAGGPAYDGYKIYKSTDGGTTFALLDTIASGETSATVDAEADDQLYIAAYNDAGESPKDATEALADGEIITVT